MNFDAGMKTDLPAREKEIPPFSGRDFCVSALRSWYVRTGAGLRPHDNTALPDGGSTGARACN